MQPGKFSTEFCEDTLTFAKQKEKTMDVGGLRQLVQKIRQEGIHFVIPEDILETESIRNYDVTRYGALRPPYPVTVVEMVTEFKEGDRMPTVIILIDVPEMNEIWWTYSLKELVPSKINPTETLFVWRITPYFWTIPYEHCGRFSEAGEPQFVFAPKHIISEAVHKKLMATSGMTTEEYYSKHATAAHIFFEFYAGFCGAMYEHEVTLTEVEPHKGQNKMRRALGKVPLFTYKVLAIGKKKRKSRHLGGTHASPRSHLRRGHYRTSKNGKRYWVQPCMVKGETPGFVHKDYKVDGEAA